MANDVGSSQSSREPSNEYSFSYAYDNSCRCSVIDEPHRIVPECEPEIPADEREKWARRLGLPVHEASHNEYAFTSADFEYFETLCQDPLLPKKKSSPKRQKKNTQSLPKGQKSSSKSYLNCTVSGEDMREKFDQLVTDAFVWIGAL
jgi:hypothetical protein